jgi:hypothetical protein
MLEREYTPENPAEDVTPDAFLELILNFGAPYRLHVDGAPDREMPRAILVGLQKRPLRFLCDGTVRLALDLATEDEDKALVGKQAGSHAFLGLDTADCLGDYRRMKALGVKFLGEPRSGPWGTGVQLEDLYGNKMFLSQEP